MTVLKVPYLNHRLDLAALKSDLDPSIKSLSTNSHIKFRIPAPSITADEFLASYHRTISERSADHCKGGCNTDFYSRLVENGTAVVDAYATN